MNHLDNNEDENHLLNDHFIEMGFENFNAIQNIGGIFFSLCYFIILVFLGILTFLILKSCDCLFPKFRKTVNKDIEEEDKENIGKNEEQS
jgi:high-affinity nickel permease